MSDHWWDDPLGTPGTPNGDDLPSEWFGVKETLFTDLVFESDAASDPYLRTLFDQAMFDPDIPSDARQDAYNAMVEYLWQEYHIDFEYVFDWEDYREWYDSVHG